MKRFLACLALCASLSASAQDDNCTVLGIQDLTQMVFDHEAQLDSISSSSLSTEVDSLINLTRGLDLRNEYFPAGDFSNRVIPKSDFSQAILMDSDFRFSVLTLSTFDDAHLQSALFRSADLRGASFLDSHCSDANFHDADLSQADFRGANVNDVVFYGAILTGAVFSCLNGCPSSLPAGYVCEPDPQCLYDPSRKRIVQQ